MRNRSLLALALAFVATPLIAQQDSTPTIIRAAVLLDGRGVKIPNAAIVVHGDRITEILVGAAASAPVKPGSLVIDLGAATVMPGLIDGHVHLNSYFNAAGRIHGRNDGDTPAMTAMGIAANMRRMLLSGVTTAQSMGASEDATYRTAAATGQVTGPRIITTLNPISDERLTPDSMRAIIRARKAEGADAIKIFASKSIREGGTTTMSAEQLNAMCGEAKALGLRTLVHAHSSESMQLASNAGCTQIEHGIFATGEVLKLMAAKGTYFDPQCGLIFRNYLETRAKYEGSGNFTPEGFASMEKAIPEAARIIGEAHATKGLKMVWGTDAVAGAHGRETDDLICRVREGKIPAMAALVSATSTGAEALGLGKEIGTIAKGYRADIIAVAGDPSVRIEALRDIVLVMQGGVIRRIESPARVTHR